MHGDSPLESLARFELLEPKLFGNDQKVTL